MPGSTSIILAHKMIKAKFRATLYFVFLALIVYFALVTSRGEGLVSLQVLGLRLPHRNNNTQLTSSNSKGASERLWHTQLTENLRPQPDEEVTQNGGGRFQPVNDYEAWVYSAFIDVINGTSVIRIFGLQGTDLKNRVFCHVTAQRKVTEVEGTKEFLPDGHNSRFCATSYVCALDMRTGSRPNNVALTFYALDTPTNQLQVLYPRARLRNFTVCHAALFRYNNPGQLVQSIEINRVLGADHFYVYNLSVSGTTDAVLRHYEKLGLLTVMQWRLPRDQVWYRGQNLAINDCVYRNRLASRYVVIQDTDEFIVPGRHNSWGELIEHVVKNKSSTAGPPSPTIGSFSVETSFHCGQPNQSQWDDIKKEFPMSPDEEQFYRNHSLFAFLNLLRIRPVMFFNRYCKTIVRPELTLFAGIHFTHVHRDSSRHTVVTNDLAIVHHYRGNNKPEVVDATILKFKNAMYPRLKAAIREFPFL